jgi:hypothetical protein
MWQLIYIDIIDLCIRVFAEGDSNIFVLLVHLFEARIAHSWMGLQATHSIRKTD